MIRTGLVRQAANTTLTEERTHSQQGTITTTITYEQAEHQNGALWTQTHRQTDQYNAGVTATFKCDSNGR